jgi:hypothetical protein
MKLFIGERKLYQAAKSLIQIQFLFCHISSIPTNELSAQMNSSCSVAPYHLIKKYGAGRRSLSPGNIQMQFESGSNIEKYWRTMKVCDATSKSFFCNVVVL